MEGEKTGVVRELIWFFSSGPAKANLSEATSSAELSVEEGKASSVLPETVVHTPKLDHASEKNSSFSQPSLFKLEEPISIPSDTELLEDLQSLPPEKLWYKMQDVVEKTRVKPHILRYWESEFDFFKNNRKKKRESSGYTRGEVEVFLVIKKLLQRDKFTLEGAKQVLSEARKTLRKDVKRMEIAENLARIENTWEKLLDLISKDKNTEKESTSPS